VNYEPIIHGCRRRLGNGIYAFIVYRRNIGQREIQRCARIYNGDASSLIRGATQVQFRRIVADAQTANGA